MSRSVHMKYTWTDQYLHFSSFVPIRYKRGLVRTLYNRALRICLTDTQLTLNWKESKAYSP